MKSFAFLITFLALLHESSAFTTVRPAISARTVVAAKDSPLTQQQMFVDLGTPDISQYPIGSIFSLFAFVAIWELVTPGRVKKED